MPHADISEYVRQFGHHRRWTRSNPMPEAYYSRFVVVHMHHVVWWPAEPAAHQSRLAELFGTH